jgi:hypothetical protein
MKAARFRIAWVMVAVAIAALNFGAGWIQHADRAIERLRIARFLDQGAWVSGTPCGKLRFLLAVHVLFSHGLSVWPTA